MEDSTEQDEAAGDGMGGCIRDSEEEAGEADGEPLRLSKVGMGGCMRDSEVEEDGEDEGDALRLSNEGSGWVWLLVTSPDCTGGDGSGSLALGCLASTSSSSL